MYVINQKVFVGLGGVGGIVEELQWNLTILDIQIIQKSHFELETS